MPWRRNAGRAKLSILALLCILFVANLAACVGLLSWSRACCSAHADRIEPDQLIVLLYGSSPADLQARIAETERLLRVQPSARAFCAGGARPSRNTFHCREVIEQFAQKGFDRARLSADTSSFDTRGNIAAAFAAAGTGGEPMFVSDALHILRVGMLARDIAPGRRYQTSATTEVRGIHLVLRLQWEIAAYMSSILPEWLRQLVVRTTRD